MKFTIPIPKTTEVMVIQTAKQGVKDGDIVIIAAAVALKDGLGVRSDQSGSAFGKAQTAGTR